MKDSSILNFDKVKVGDNTKVMIDCEKIADGEGLEVFQSQNRNVITIKHNGYFYHVLIGNIVDAVLMGIKGKE